MKRSRTPRVPLPITRPKVGISDQPELIIVDGEPVLELRAKLGLSREIFARLMNVSPRTIYAVERNRSHTRRLRRPYTELTRLCVSLMWAFPRCDIGLWLLSPLRNYGRSTPLELIECGESCELWELVFSKLFVEPLKRKLTECREQISEQNCQVRKNDGQS
jgi:DNA-binding XRE family transcriptional regulator